jgi:hypothetical protein
MTRLAFLVLASMALAAPARAQFQPKPVSDPATGERYHIEAAASLWFPSADMSISSQSLGIPGSTIDFKNDLGLTDQHFGAVRLEARGGRSKFRFQYIPITYEQTATLPRDIVFNGQRYRAGAAATSMLEWKAYRLAYEYDYIKVDRGFAGFIFEFKHTDVTATLQSPLNPTPEFTRAKAPLPALGLNFRVYPVPNISITGEVTGIKVPDNLIKNTGGHYVEVDVYGTVNFTNNVGVQLGYRSLDVGYLVNTDSGSFVVKGLYFGVVARY